MNKPLISACYCIKNAEDFLWYSVKSVYDYVDEIILIDDQSTDDTIDIIKSFPQDKITLIRDKFDGNKKRQRSEYLKRARGKFIFQIDDDEIYKAEQLQFLRKFIKNTTANEIFFKFIWFWKGPDQIISGHHWDQNFETFYRNLEGLSYDVHHHVSWKGRPLSRVGPVVQLGNKVQTYHYSHCKSDEKIRAKIWYYMLRDNPNVTKHNVEDFVNKHPHFSGNFNHPRFGPGGLQIAGNVGGTRDKLIPYKGTHPDVMKGHRMMIKDMKQYKTNMNKYMEQTWRYHNHLHHERHTNRIRYTAEFCIGNTVEVGCASGISTNIMRIWLEQKGIKNVTFTGVEPSNWGYAEACKNHPNIKFVKAMGEDLPFEDKQFETVLCAEVVEHVLDPIPFVKECVRVCKTRLIITLPNGDHPDPDHKRVFSPKTLSRLMEPYIKDSPKMYGLDIIGKRVTDLRNLYFMICVGNRR